MRRVSSTKGSLVHEPTPDEIQRRMAQLREDLQCRARRLRENAATLTDWRYHVRRHPWVTVGVGAALGYLVIPKRRSTAQAVAAEASTTQRSTPQSKGILAAAGTAVAGVLMRMALTYAKQRFGNVVADFAAKAQAGAAQRPTTDSSASYAPRRESPPPHNQPYAHGPSNLGPIPNSNTSTP